jgi:hypothetical protein
MKIILNIAIILFILKLNANGQIKKDEKFSVTGVQKGGSTTNQTRPGSTSQKVQIKFYTTAELNKVKAKYISNKTEDEVKKDPKFLKLSLQERQYSIEGAIKPKSVQRTIGKDAASEVKKIEIKRDGVTYRFTSNPSDEKRDTTSIKPDPEPEELPGKKTRVCRTIGVDLLSSSPEAYLYDNRETVAYPTSVLDLKSLLDGSYKVVPIKGKQNKMTITVSGIIGGTNVTHELVPDANGLISRAVYASALNNLRNQYFKEEAVSNTNSDYELIEITDSKELKAKLDFAFGEKGDKVFFNTDNSGNTYRTKRTIIAKSIQKMYSVGIGAADINYLYDPTIVKPSDAAVVTQINYGIMKFIKFETDLSIDSLNIALNAAYGNYSGGASFNLRKSLSKTNIKVITLGVGADNLPKELTVENLYEYLNKPEVFNKNTSGVPLSWQLAFLNGGEVCYTEIVTKFNYPECQTVNPKKLSFNLTGIMPTKNNLDLCGKITAKVVIGDKEIEPSGGNKLLLDCDCKNKSKWIRNLKKDLIEPLSNINVEYMFSQKDLEANPKLLLTFDIGDALQDIENTFDISGKKAIMYNLDGGTKILSYDIPKVFPTKFIPILDSEGEGGQKILKLNSEKGKDKIYLRGSIDLVFVE